MSSPFYPFPSPQSLPSPLSNLLPSIAQQTSGLALTPSTNPFLGLAPPSQFPQGQVQGGGGGTVGPSTSVGSVRSGIRREEVTLEDTLRALEEGGVLIDRARGVLEEIGRMEGLNFRGEVDSGRGMTGGIGTGTGRLEYDQIINTLYTLSISSSFGALPLLPHSSSIRNEQVSSSDPIADPIVGTGTGTSASNSIPNSQLTTNTANVDTVERGTFMDTTELISWCESRAGLEFSRREGIKNGSKVVLDILKAR